jgi:hypothetical protein
MVLWSVKCSGDGQIGTDGVVGLARDVALDAADRFWLGEAFSEPSLDVGLSALMIDVISTRIG